MSLYDTHRTVLGIINEVRKRIAITEVETIDADAYGPVHLQLLNETVSEIGDLGDWNEDYKEFTVAIEDGVRDYSVARNSAIKRIDEVALSGISSPLRKIENDQLRKLVRAGSTGTPRFWSSFKSDDAQNPIFTVSPMPDASMVGKSFIVAAYTKARRYTEDDIDAIPPYPANLLIKGLYARAVLELNEGYKSQPIDAAFKDYYQSIQEAINRFTNDAGTDIRFVPKGLR